MKLVCQTKLHFKEGNSDKVYEVDLCETSGKFVVNFRYGRRGSELQEGTKTVLPVSLAEAEKIFQKLVDEKTRKGYHVAGEIRESSEKSKSAAPKSSDEKERNAWILDKLADAKAKSNPRLERMIWRAGELKIIEAAPLIANFVGSAKDLRDYCIAWSLGFCGDRNSIPVLENLARHSAEFVRRIAREALFKLADENTKVNLIEKAVAELPEILQTEASSGTAESFEMHLREEIGREKRRALTVLARIYEIDRPTVRPALVNLLREIPFKPRYFKAIRQIFKAAEYRRDAEVFGIIARRLEIEGAAFYSSPWWDSMHLQDENGKWERVKRSAELARETSRLAYSDKTRDYFRRRTWRTLRRLGEINDADYVRMATGALLQFSDADAVEPKRSVTYDYYHTGRWDWQNPLVRETFWDEFSPYLILNHILYQNSPRYEHKTGSRGFRLKNGFRAGGPVPKEREEAFPKLWEAQPVALLHLLSESECRPVHEFAVKVLRACSEYLETLDARAIMMLLERPYEITNQLGFELAVKYYDTLNPQPDLALAVALCRSAEARRQAFEWIEARRELFAKNERAMLKLLAAAHADTREFAARLLLTTNYSQQEAQNLIALLLSELIGFDESGRETAADLSAALFRSFGKQLRALNLSVVNDLLAHPLVEVQILGGQILVNHETEAENLPDALIDSLINSPFEQIRALGIKLFGQLPDDNLLKRERVILSLLAHALADVHHAIRPTAARLGFNFPLFRENLVNAIFIELLQPEKAEGVHARLLDALRETDDWTRFADFEATKLLIGSQNAQANEIGGLILQARAADWSGQFTTEELIDLSSHEIFSVRQASWQIAESVSARLRGEVSLLIRALDAKWEDSRKFWRGFFRARLTADELSPEILTAICDSVRDETQKFGRDLLLDFFREENGADYLIKLSEHPSAAMQLFATNYLENHAADAPEKLARLAPYFVRVLSAVNRSRAAKDRVLLFLEREALKNEQSARIAADILARQSATIAVGDKASMIETMLKIRRKFPDIELPVKIKQTEVRARAV